MVVIWSEPAINDLKNYSKHSKIINDTKLQNYINSLIDYGNSLATMPNLGKDFMTYKSKTIKQLLYNMHRIFYYIEENEIIIIQISHTSRKLDNVIKAMKTLLK